MVLGPPFGQLIDTALFTNTLPNASDASCRFRLPGTRAAHHLDSSLLHVPGQGHACSVPRGGLAVGSVLDLDLVSSSTGNRLYSAAQVNFTGEGGSVGMVKMPFRSRDPGRWGL